MLQDDMFVGGQFAWFTGIVEDVNDPEQMNRVKVRCLGWYGEKVDVPTADLPWATVLLPNTSASKSGVGSTHELMVDSWVVGFFRDGNSAQDPIVIGSIQVQQKVLKIYQKGLKEIIILIIKFMSQRQIILLNTIIRQAVKE